MLKVSNLNSYYGKSHISTRSKPIINEGEIVSLLGRNGVGRVLLSKASWVWLNLRVLYYLIINEILGKPVHEIANLGIGYVSENRDIFPDLTVRENLELGKKENKYGIKWNIRRII